MPADITNIIRSLSVSIDTIKKLAELAKKSQSVELREGIQELKEQLLIYKEELLDVKQENVALKNENTELKQQLKNSQNQKPQLIVQDGLYYSIKEDGTTDGPFCTGCFDKNGKTNRLSKLPDIMKDVGRYQCPVCHAPYQ